MVAIADPVRARIFFEILLHRKVTAKHLMKRLSISRSTLSYHLKKLEDDGILEVGISTEGRPSKQYSLCPEFSAPSFEAHVDESLDWLTWRSVWLQRTIVHLQAVVSIAMTGLEELNKAIQVIASQIIEIKRRVNALEYILIPELEGSVRYIRMKLSEMERSTIVSLLKIKDIVRAR